MNREIKFRTWNFPTKRMYYWGTLQQINQTDKRNIEAEHNRFMQYTGLKDKNGKEAYEGDILNFDYPMEIIWDMGSWVVKAKKGSSLLYGYVHEGEVIGNIYENKDLLK